MSSRFLAAAGLVGFAAAAVGIARAPAADSWRTPGERFYLTGDTGAGAPVEAVVQGDLRVRSTDMPCSNCHRRSGWAGPEGTVSVPPVTGPALYSPLTRGQLDMGTLRSTGPGTRPAYDDATLLRAIREGVDPSGRSLSPTMPRYELSDADGAALVAHLRSLSAEPPPGVTGAEVHLATVTAPGTDAAERAAMLEVLRAFVRDKNAETRRETRRRERGPWDMKQHYENYRRLVLHEWELTGAPAEWAAQLEALYRQRPVFSIVAGLASGDWTPVHEFAERFRVPVVLPQTPLPARLPVSQGFFTFYFSRGVTLEADTLAGRLSKDPPPQVVQLSRCGTAGHAAAARVEQRLSNRAEVVGRCIDRQAPLPADPRALGLEEGAALVLWLGRADLDAVAPALMQRAGAVYLSSTLLGATLPRSWPASGGKALLLHPFVPPDELDRHAWRSLAWLEARGLADRPRQVAVNTLFAASLTAEALTHPRALDSREYFLERVEHMAGRSPSRSAYPEVIFGVERRFGSAGCYVLEVPTSPEANYRKVGAWSVPRS